MELLEQTKLKLPLWKTVIDVTFFMTVCERRQKHIFLSKRAVSNVVLEVETAEEKKLTFTLWKTVIHAALLYDNGRRQKHIFLPVRVVIYVDFEVEPLKQIKHTFPL